MHNHEFTHKKWGTIRISVNKRAHRIIMRAGTEFIRITVPVYATATDIERALERHGEKLRQQQKFSKKLIDTQYTAGHGRFRIEVKEYNGKEFMWIHEPDCATLMCPAECDFAERQEWLQKAVKNVIAEEAKKVLPKRLAELADGHGLKYSRCSVRDSHGRWGSCNTKGNISLSMYLILLPEELIDYVLLHELCHTLEMNHSENFWAKLENMCKGNAKRMRKQLKSYIPNI